MALARKNKRTNPFMPSERLLKQLLKFRRGLAEEHGKLRVRSGDVRDVGLRNSAESVSKYIFLRGLIAKAWEADKTQSLFAAVNIMRPDQVRFVQSVINGCDRALITDLHFQLEHMTCCLAKRVARRKYRSLVPAAEALIRALHPLVSVTGVQRLSKPFRVASAIRNCLHNNGVHANKSFQAKVGKDRYRFSSNQVVFYGLSSFLSVLEAAWNECAFWFGTCEVRRLTVMDKFAADIGIKLHEFMQHVSATSAEMDELLEGWRPTTPRTQDVGRTGLSGTG